MTRPATRFLLFAAAALALGTAAMFLPVEWRLPGPAATATTPTATIAVPRPSAFGFAVGDYQRRWNHVAADIPDLIIEATTSLSPTVHHAVFVGAEALMAGGIRIDLFMFTDGTGAVTEVLLQSQGAVLETQISDLLGLYVAAAALGLDSVEDIGRFASPIMGIELFPVVDYYSIEDESLITMRIGSVLMIREASADLLAYRVRP
jgi:hypothetical protein